MEALLFYFPENPKHLENILQNYRDLNLSSDSGGPSNLLVFKDSSDITLRMQPVDEADYYCSKIHLNATV